jgi:hypothetical protein
LAETIAILGLLALCGWLIYDKRALQAKYDKLQVESFAKISRRPLSYVVPDAPANPSTPKNESPIKPLVVKRPTLSEIRRKAEAESVTA